MSVKNPTTYAEWYWAQNVDAQKVYADEKEEALLPFVKDLLSDLEGLDDYPGFLLGPLLSLGTPGNFGVAAIGEGALSGATSSGLMSAIAPSLRGIGYAANKKRPNQLIDVGSLMTLAHRRRVTPDLYTARASWHGYTDDEIRLLYDATSPYPDILDLFRWARYSSDNNDVWSRVQGRLDIPDEDFTIWEFLSQQHLTSSDVQSLFVRGYMDEQTATAELIRQGYRPLDASAMVDLSYGIPNATVLVQSGLHRRVQRDALLDSIITAGVHPDYAEDYLSAVLVKPDPNDVIRYMLRTDPNLSGLDEQLARVGVHPDYIELFRELAYPVPPVGDMITMAVREAFSPAIASRFGQYDDYPTDLTRYAAMNGISEEWAKRYWAAHWSLPSPQQGFEMYHRGIITYDELQMLLRALDVMPFWRDRLIQMAFRPLTRVDVRRMYALGVLSEQEVEKAYKDQGYDETNARRLKDFVVKDTIKSQSGLSVSKVVTAYKLGYATRQESHNAIVSIGVRPNNVTNILDAADSQLHWQRIKDSIAAIGNQYKQEFIEEPEARNQLRALRLDEQKINTLILRWQTDAQKEHGTLLTKADVLQMLTRKVIDVNRARTELKLLGYNTERTELLIANVAAK